MSRHRMVRTMNYEDEYFDDDDQDYYSRSVEDKYGVSPSTAAEFTYQREKNVDFSSFMRSESITEEEETADSSHVDLHREILNTSRLELSDEDQARLNSCLEELQNVLGDSVPESVMASVVIQNNFNMETSLHQLLDAPKTQREPRKQRNRSQDDIDTDELDNLLSEIKYIEDETNDNVLYLPSSLRYNFGLNDQTPPEIVDISKNMNIESNKFEISCELQHQKLDSNNHKMFGQKIRLENEKENLDISLVSGKDNKMSKGDFSQKQHEMKKDCLAISGGKGEKQTSLQDVVSKSGHKSSPESKLGLSLAELARQHKKSSSPSPSAQIMSKGSSVPASGSSSMAQPMANLSTLVAQHSAKSAKKSSSATSVNSGSYNLNFRTGGLQNPGSKNDSSLMGLIKQSGQTTGKTAVAKQSSYKPGISIISGVSLGELAQQYKSMSVKSIKTEAEVRKRVNNTSEENVNLDMSNKISKMSLKNVIQNSGDMQKPNSLMSLTACLKTSGHSGSKKQVVPEKKKSLTKTTTLMKKKSLPTIVPESIIPRLEASPLPLPDPLLVATASPVGLALCQVRRKRKLVEENIPLPMKKRSKYPQFLCVKQVGKHILYAEVKVSHVKMFDYSTPSPDDIVRAKQKQAFTRNDKEFQI